MCSSKLGRIFYFIIIDDGSTDGSGRIIERWAAEDARIIPINKPNTGLADSLNVGIGRTRGAWIARIDADDRWEPERLALQWRAVAEGEGEALVFLGTGLVLIDEQGMRSAVYRYPTDHCGLVYHLTTWGPFPAHSSALFRMDAFRRVGGYRPRLNRCEDWDLWLRLAEVGELTTLRRPLVQIRKYASQISHDEGGRQQLIDCHVAMVNYWLRQAGYPDPIAADPEEFEVFRSWLVECLIADHLFDREVLRQSIQQAKIKFLYQFYGAVCWRRRESSGLDLATRSRTISWRSVAKQIG